MANISKVLNQLKSDFKKHPIWMVFVILFFMWMIASVITAPPDNQRVIEKEVTPERAAEIKQRFQQFKLQKTLDSYQSPAPQNPVVRGIDQNIPTYSLPYYSTSNIDYETEDSDYGSGYSWAEDNNVDNFNDCQSHFGTSDAENGCNDYVKENYTGYQSFNGYECTEDCSGHEAGYNWAEEKDIDDIDDCGGNSGSFIEGCESYVEENY